MTAQPNILWLTYEDTSPQFVSCYGHTPVVTTPVIDQLAHDGIRFNNVFATAPVCSASRSALITGVCNEATGLGHHRSKYPVPRGLIKGFPYYLQEAGYYTTNNVKTDYNITDEADFIRETWNESSTSAHWRNRREGQPFFSVFNHNDSHQSRTMTKPWGWYQENVLDQLAADEIISPDDVKMPPIYRDTSEMRRHVSRVYNSLRLCDRVIGERIQELVDDGLMEDTIIFCFADHGEGIPRGKCNGIGFGYRASCVAYVPEKYRSLSPWGSQTVTDELISFEDLAPTVLSLAGIAAPDHFTGRALMGDHRTDPRQYVFAARNRLDDTPDLCRSAMDGRFVYTRNYFPHLPVVKYQKYSDVGDILRCIRKDYAENNLDQIQAELVEPTRPIEYLYDLKSDPWEIDNLAGNPEYTDDLRRLRSATVKHGDDVHDVMFLPEREMIGRLDGGSPYEMRGDNEYNPLARMRAAAELVGDFKAIGRQIDLLRDNDDAVRYWAAVGLYAARDHIESHADLIRPFLHDESPSVHIELAGALYGSTGDEESKSILERYVTGTDNYLAHQAIVKILYMPDAAASFSEVFSDPIPAEPGVDNAGFPRLQAADMYRYLYMDDGLFYPDDIPYLEGDDRKRIW